MPINYSLYLVVDADSCHPRTIIEAVAEVIDAGITCVQLRLKNVTDEVLIHSGQALLTLLKSKKIPLIINDNVAVAKFINADGVHIGQNDMAYDKARAILGPDKIIGLSIENYQQAQACRLLAVDYFGVGPIYPTQTKLNAAPPLGITELKKIVSLLTKPVVAIGGINQENINGVLQTGATGAAIVSAILRSPCPFASAHELNHIITTYREKI